MRTFNIHKQKPLKAMQANHTPGPWNYMAQNNGQFIVETPQKSICWLDRHYEPSESDARLIAAAPEMLDALQACLDYLLLDSMMEEDAAPEIEKIRAAIAKAKGEA